jgi:hypothetical protein
MKWEKQLVDKAEREYAKIGEVKRATSVLDGFKRCKLQFFRHYHYMTCTDFLIEVSTTIFFCLDTPLDIYYLFSVKFFDKWFFYLQLIMTIFPIVVLMVVVLYTIHIKTSTKESACAIFWLAMFSNIQVEGIGERGKRSDLGNKGFFLLFEDTAALLLKIKNSMCIGSTLSWAEPISIFINFAAMLIAGHQTMYH